ncbi:MAG: tetratricopeptide repeat protein [Rhodospirillaceae bacterium]|nr:tetratricopeptide repeat protein [Rhodospirillaceae bacterium]
MSDPETLLQQAGQQARSGNGDGARRLLADLIALAGTPPQVLLGGAFEAYQLGDIGLAERALRRAIEIAPDFAAAHTNLGNILREQGRLDEAIAATEVACELAPREPMNFANLGSLFEENQRPDKAETAFREALARAPGEPGLLDALGRILIKLARPAEAMAALKAAIETAPGLASAHLNMGNLYQEAEQFGAAAKAYQTALDIEPNDISARGNLALVNFRQGNLEQAEAGFSHVTKMAPHDPVAFNNLTQVRYQRGELQAALAACDGALACDPGNRTALSNKVIVLNEIPDRAAVRYLQNIDAFVTAQYIATPAGYDSVAAFNDALFGEVEAEPDRFSERGQTGARQTRDIMLEPGPAVRAYAGVINGAVRDYIANLAPDPAHPFASTPPHAWRLEAWGTISREIPEGEDTHIHPTAWLSGVYYPRLPAAVRNDNDTGGFLEVGRAPNHIVQTQAPELKIVKPEMGLLVLFPSFVYHRILPFTSPLPRMSVAFDAVPI